MSGLQDEILAKINTSLHEELVRIDARISELVLQDPFSDPERTNDNAASDHEASEESNHDRVAALVEELKEKKAEIQQSLTRVADGEYGKCIVCARPIEIERLSVLPTATMCLRCEQQRDRG